MDRIDTIVIGAGHAGLAVSRSLTDRGIEHVVLERGRVGQRWLTARWDSFRLLTPNWLTRLPGWSYRGPDPDGFMTAAEFVDYLRGYADSFDAPLLDGTTVVDVRPGPAGFDVTTDRTQWTASNVVLATGYHAMARVPALAAGLPAAVSQLNSASYRGPGQVREGSVLVVGASASGAQIAEELARAGRDVVLAVGSHTRLPRRYRDRDILWWLERTGSLDRRIEDLPDPGQARREPSLQLSGTGRPVDLVALQQLGVRLAGRLTGLDTGVATFADDLGRSVAAADARMDRVLSRVDTAADHRPAQPSRPAPVPVPGTPARLDLARDGITSVVWATGLRPTYPWLSVPALDSGGHLIHRRGVTLWPGLYAMGLPFQHRRSSTFIDGARHDAAYIVDHIAARRRLCHH